MSPCLTAEVQLNILYCLAEEIIEIKQLDETVSDLVTNPYKLRAYVTKTPIDWRRIAKKVGADRRKVYHWYCETHSRHILTIKMTEDDREEIRGMVAGWIRRRQVPDGRLYDEVHRRFGERYSRQELRMRYNNILNSRYIQTVLEECNVQRPVRWRKAVPAIVPTAVPRPPSPSKEEPDAISSRISSSATPVISVESSAALDDELAGSAPIGPGTSSPSLIQTST